MCLCFCLYLICLSDAAIICLTESELCCRLKAMIDDLTKLHQRQSDFGHWSISRPEHNDADSSGARKRCAGSR